MESKIIRCLVDDPRCVVTPTVGASTSVDVSSMYERVIGGGYLIYGAHLSQVRKSFIITGLILVDLKYIGIGDDIYVYSDSWEELFDA